ncbi:hypothetical protein [Paraburkholderia sp. SIMBA_054]|uniref:hypothetical protein n=1 Tax=Paraburkholderia sp. SIMBA_054 TaxID=3085795 RepID=UPI00397DDE87
MYSSELVDLARVVDRLTVGLYRARVYDLNDHLHDVTGYITERYLSAMESTVPVLQARFAEMLVEESRPYGAVEVIDGKILVPDWVERQFDGYVDGDEFHCSTEDIQRFRAEGYKVLFEPPGPHGYDINRLRPEVPDELIEVWWSRADNHFACGPHKDICGFLTKVDGLGWQIFAAEQ